MNHFFSDRKKNCQYIAYFDFNDNSKPNEKDNLQTNIDRIKILDISAKEKDLILGENIKTLNAQ